MKLTEQDEPRRVVEYDETNRIGRNEMDKMKLYGQHETS